MKTIKPSTPIYNGYSLKNIIANFPKGMIKTHKKQYLNNCIEVFRNEESKVNLSYNECLKNTNFNLILFYNNL